MKTCKKCTHKNEDYKNFCSKCGFKLNDIRENNFMNQVNADKVTHHSYSYEHNYDNDNIGCENDTSSMIIQRILKILTFLLYSFALIILLLNLSPDHNDLSPVPVSIRDGDMNDTTRFQVANNIHSKFIEMEKKYHPNAITLSKIDQKEVYVLTDIYSGEDTFELQKNHFSVESEDSIENLTPEEYFNYTFYYFNDEHFNFFIPILFREPDYTAHTEIYIENNTCSFSSDGKTIIYTDDYNNYSFVNYYDDTQTKKISIFSSYYLYEEDNQDYMSIKLTFFLPTQKPNEFQQTYKLIGLD